MAPRLLRQASQASDIASAKLGTQLKRSVGRASRLIALQRARANLLVKAVLWPNSRERTVLIASIRRRLNGDPPPPVAPHQAAVAEYVLWQDRFDTPTEPDIIRLKQTEADQPDTLIVARFSAATVRHIDRTVDTLRNGIGIRWKAQIILADDAKADSVEYAASDERVRILSAESARFRFQREERPGGSVMVLLDGGALPRPHGIRVLVDALVSNPNATIAYCDEDMLRADGTSDDPWFKPAYSPLLAAQGALFGRMVAVRMSDKTADTLRSMAAPDATVDAIARDIAKRCGKSAVVHVPHVLFHNVTPRPSPVAVSLPLLPEILPTTSIIIPTRDAWDVLSICLDSLERTDWPRDRLEIIVVDNGSTDPATLEGLSSGEQTGRIRVLRDPGRFNYSRLNNMAVRAARGDLLVLLNNDTEILDPAWLRTLAAYALQPQAGAVGSKLLYPDRTVQHGGVVLGIQGVAGHAHLFLDADEGGYQSLATLTHEVAAVTGACLAVTRDAYEAVGGLDETFQVSFNDIVFCLDLIASGRTNVYVAAPLLMHHESKTRGLDDKPEKIRRARSEARRAWMRHADLLRDDPYYSPNLSLEIPYALAFAPRRRAAWRQATGATLKIMMLSLTHAQGHGVAVVIDQQVRHLASRGHEIIVAGVRGKRDFDYGGRSVIEVHDPRSAATLAADHGVDVIVAHTPPYFSVARWTGAYPPVIAYDYGEPEPDFFPEAAIRREIQAEKDASLSMCGRVFAISNAVAAEATSPPGRVIPLGNAHLGRWTPQSAERRRRIRLERGWEDCFVVLNVCRFHAAERAYKGVDLYADVQAALQVIDPELSIRTVFVLCGKGDPTDVVAMQDRCLSVFANVTDEEMADLYAAADLYANFSRWEGYNLGIGQALAMGLPVVASDIPAHRAFGVTVVSSAAEAARRVRDFGRQPPERVPRVWEWDESLRAFAAEIEDIAAETRPWGSRNADPTHADREATAARLAGSGWCGSSAASAPD